MGGQRRRVSLISVVRVLAAAALLSACASSPEAPDQDRSTDVGAFEFPDAARATGASPLSLDERATIFAAEDAAVRDCMAQQGFDYLAPPAAPPIPWYLPPEALRSSGYGVSPDDLDVNFPAEPSGDLSGGLVGAALEDWRTALNGSGDEETVEVEVGDGTLSTMTGGCRGEARRRLYGSEANQARFDVAFQAEHGSGLVGWLRQDPAYEEAMTKWRACLNDTGVLSRFTFPDGEVLAIGSGQDYGLSALARLWPSGSGMSRPTEAEMAEVAAADASCLESTGLQELRVGMVDDARRESLRGSGIDPDVYDAFARWLYERAVALASGG